MGPPASHAFHQRVWCVALVVHVITAWFSSGFYAADEHYQVIAFAQAKLGELPVAHLPWEYEARIRSALLPGLAYAVIGTCRSMITAEPFHIAFLLRLLTALFALAVVRTFVRAVIPQVSDGLHKPFILLSYFLWFLPYQHVRFAAETWSGMLFLLGLAQLLGKRGNRWNMLSTGLCFGLSLQVKPVMCIACLGAIAWSLFAEKDRRAPLLHLLAGLVSTLTLGILVDYWFYREYTPTLWNYMRLAVDGDPAHTFETFPWYCYIPWLMKYGIWPIGAALVAGLFWLTYRSPRAVLVWCIWPYLLLVSAIPHKELRFLFPLVDLAPLVLVLAWQQVEHGKLTRVLKHRAVLIPFIAINVGGLVVASTTAAGSGRTRLAEALWDEEALQGGSLGYNFDHDLIWKARIPFFYLPAPTRDVGTYDPCAHSLERIDNDAPELLVSAEPDHASGSCLPDSIGYYLVSAAEHDWTRVPMLMYNDDRPRRLMLYARDDRNSHPSEP